MSPIYLDFTMFRETWNDKSDGTFRDRKPSELFWNHGTDHQTFTTEGTNNRLIEHATVACGEDANADHGVCCLVSFDSGERKVARLNSDTKFILREQLPPGSLQKQGVIKALSEKGIIVVDGFSEIRNAEAFEHHLRVGSYFYRDYTPYEDDDNCKLTHNTSSWGGYPKWPSADEMANYGFVFKKILDYRDRTYAYMSSIWQSELLTGFKRNPEKFRYDVIYLDDVSFVEKNNFLKATIPINKKDPNPVTIEHIYAHSCSFAKVDQKQYLAELEAARSEPVLKLNRSLQNKQHNSAPIEVTAQCAVVQTEDSSLPQLRLIIPEGLRKPKCDSSDLVDRLKRETGLGDDPSVNLETLLEGLAISDEVEAGSSSPV